MNEEETAWVLGWRIYGLGVMALGMVCLAWGNFDLGQPVPGDFPRRTALAYVAAAFMLGAGAAVEWRRIAARGAAALTVYYVLIVVILMNGRVILAHPAEFGAYSGGAEQLAIAAGALIVYAASAKIDAARAAILTRLGQLAFGVCALLFGGRIFFEGDPRGVGICNCLACQQRTGSVFATLASYSAPFKVFGTATEYVRVGDQGARFTFRFCPICGTTVFHTEEGESESVSVAVGAFADPAFPVPRVSVYDSRRHSWVQLPAGIRTFDKDPP